MQNFEGFFRRIVLKRTIVTTEAMVCGAVGRAVASDIRDLPFEPIHRQSYLNIIHIKTVTLVYDIGSSTILSLLLHLLGWPAPLLLEHLHSTCQARCHRVHASKVLRGHGIQVPVPEDLLKSK